MQTNHYPAPTDRIVVTGDWEVTEERIPTLEGPIKGLIDHIRADGTITGFAFTGDMFRRFSPATVLWVREVIRQIYSTLRFRRPDPIMIFVAGNHDRAVGIDRLSAIFEPEFHISTEPEILTFDSVSAVPGGSLKFEVAVLPAPDRAKFGAYRDSEGPRSRDQAISDALNAAVVYLEHNAKDPESTPLLFHGSIAEDEFGPGIIAGGLTWAIPAVRIYRFGAAIGGHIHNPKTFSSDGHKFVGYTGTPAPDTHGVRAVKYRFLTIKGTDVETHYFPDSVQMIEADIVAGGITAPAGTKSTEPLPFCPFENLSLAELSRAVVDFLGVVGASGPVDLKLVARLPKSSLSVLPSTEDLGRELEGMRVDLKKIVLRREPTNETKDETTESVGGKLSPTVLFDEFLRTSGLEDHPGAGRARVLLETESFSEWTRTERRSFVPLFTRVRNYRQFEDALIDWRLYRGKIAITGDNTAGKSNLAKATIFATHKRLPGGSVRLEEILRFGSNEGFVETGFLADGVEYLVRRGLERNVKGAVSCKTEFFRVDGAERFPIEEKSSDIDRAIADIVGPLSLVLSTFYGMGSDVTRIVKATPAEFRAIVADAFSLSILEEFRAFCSKEKRGLEAKILPIETRINVHAGAMVTTAAKLEDMPPENELNEQIARIESAISTAREGIEGNRRGIDALSARSGALSTRLGGRQDLVNKIARLKDVDIPSTEREIARLDRQIDEWSPTEISVQDLEGFEKTVQDARELWEYAAGARDEQNRIAKDLESQGRTAAKNLEGLRKQKTALEEVLRKQTLELETLPPVPCDDIPTAGSIKTPCPAWKAFSKAEHLQATRESVQDLDPVVSKCSDEVVDLQAKHEGALRLLEAYREDAQAAESALALLEKDLKKHREALARSRASLEATRVRDRERGRLESMREDLVRDTADLAALDPAQIELDKILDSMSTLAADIKSAESKIRDDEMAIRDLMKDRIRRNETEKVLQSEKDNLEKAKGELSAMAVDFEAWSLLESAFHSTGIPLLLMRKILPALEAEANYLLSSTDISISIEAVRERADGTKKDDIEVRFIDSRGEFSLNSSSGYQEQVNGLALRFALATTANEFWGRPLVLFIQDEGFGAFHRERYPMAIDIIEKIAHKFERFVYITHVTELAEIADHRLDVQSITAGTSRVVDLSSGQ